MAAWALEQTDCLRRSRGALLDAAGLGPLETPFRVVHAQAGLTLRSYGEPSRNGPVVLLIPAPIKRCYIWDLAPDISVVRHCLQRGMRVYLAEWLPMGKNGQDFGIGKYADRLLSDCVDAIEADSGQHQVILAGHSLGGTFSTIFACLHPQRVRSLVLLESPLHFAEEAGSFAPLVAATPDVAPIVNVFGAIPGSFLNLVCIIAAPSEFEWRRYMDLFFCAGNVQALVTHMRVERWMLDEFPLPGKLFTEIVELLYRGDYLMQGRLAIHGKRIGPSDVTVPLLSVFDPRSAIIPPQSVIPFHQAAPGSPKKLLSYEGDVGVAIQHVGVLVGKNAHVRLWPAIFDWLAHIEARA